MKIAITSLYLPSSSKIGVGYQVHALANKLISKGHEVHVYTPAKKPLDANYEVITVPPPKRLRTFAFAWNLRKFNFSGYDVLNAHGDDWFLWFRKRPKHVHTYHGSCFAEMLNQKTIKGRVRSALLALCEYNSLALATDTVSVSENTRKYIPGIKHIIPCGVDLDKFTPQTNKAKDPTLLFVGTMHGRKRGRLLLKLFQEEILKNVPDAQLWCVCDQPSDIEAKSNVKFFGRISEERLCELYQKAWVFCLPSTYEGFGVPYIEAMASGTPVVASPNPGACEVLKNGKYGRICTDTELATSVINLLQNGPLRSRYIKKGLTRSRDFSWDFVCDAYEKVYRGD